MSLAETVALGALAGFTIFLGLPLGRVQTLSPRARVALAMFSVGILAFIFVDVFEHAFEIVEEPVEELKDGDGSLGTAIGYTLMIGVGFVVGSAGLAQIERLMRPKGPRTPPIAGGAILYVIGEIWTAMRRYSHRELGLYLLAAGFMAGLITDLVVVYGGG